MGTPGPGPLFLITVSVVLFKFLGSGSCSTIKFNKIENEFGIVKSVHSGALNSTGIGNPEFGSVFDFFAGLKNFNVQRLIEAKPWNDDKLLSSMASSLISSTSSVRALEHLQSLKTTLLNQFHKQARELVTGRSEVEARDPHHGHGAIGFPSLEGALLSLAFLTFAVFLIDLIQQLVSRYRTGYAFPLGRRRRSITEYPHVNDEQGNNQTATLTSHVLSAIENPLFLNGLYDL